MAVIGIPCNSDFGTSSKSELIGEGVWSEVLIFGRGMDAKNVGVWYLCRLASKDLGDLSVLPRSNWELRSSGLLSSE